MKTLEKRLILAILSRETQDIDLPALNYCPI